MFKKESTADSKTISTLPKKKVSFCLVLHWGGKKEVLFKSRQTFEFAAARTSGLVDPVLSRQTFFFFFECEHPFIDKSSQRSKRWEVPSYDKTDDHKWALCTKRTAIRPVS